MPSEEARGGARAPFPCAALPTPAVSAAEESGVEGIVFEAKLLPLPVPIEEGFSVGTTASDV